MNAKTLIAAAALFTAASAVFAADSAPAAATTAAASAPVAAAAAVTATAQTLNLPSVTVSSARSRAEVHAEAVDFVAHYKTALQTQLEWSNN